MMIHALALPHWVYERFHETLSNPEILFEGFASKEISDLRKDEYYSNYFSKHPLFDYPFYRIGYAEWYAIDAALRFLLNDANCSKKKFFEYYVEKLCIELSVTNMVDKKVMVEEFISPKHRIQNTEKIAEDAKDKFEGQCPIEGIFF